MDQLKQKLNQLAAEKERQTTAIKARYTAAVDHLGRQRDLELSALDTVFEQRAKRLSAHLAPSREEDTTLQ